MHTRVTLSTVIHRVKACFPDAKTSKRIHIARFILEQAQPYAKPSNLPISPEDKITALQIAQELEISQRAAALVKNLPPLDTIRALMNMYPEIAWLTGQVNATPETRFYVKETLTLGEMLFQKISKAELIEFDRTAVGLLTLGWVLRGDYESFTACQSKGSRLTEESFRQLQELTREILPNEEAIYAMITYDAMTAYIIINDLGKIQAIVDDIEKRFGVTDVDHDNILLFALENYPETSPSFQRLSPHYKNIIIEGLKARFNLAQ